MLRFLGEGGKKRVFLAHDALLDRDIAFSLIKTDGLDDVGRERIMREAQAMGRLSHQNIVAIYDIGEHTTADGSKQPFLVQELMGGGDVEDLLKDAEGALPLQQSLDIALATARGLEFAHEAGVIHRDIKPGNVWLTTNGEAKIGDLGLAVTLDQSRLTSHGMMVGTFGYMPPEQALGQEVTPQADLYSLGAMLYEMVTGRTPFEGDTPTAVISQHLNTQPVAPSWHTEHCPPDLEALILRLLEKEPGKRPASANEVSEALERVDPEARSISHSDSQTNPLDRLARGVFVGREKELEQLHEALNGAMEGRGSVVMLVGEPGIGKTRTVQELETYARMRGANVYWGRTHESAGMPAYWPWLQVGRAWAATRDLTDSATQAAIQNPQLMRLFPELHQLVPGLPDPPPLDETDGAQFMLFDAYTQFMRAQSSQQPWVVVLDDLHWADKPTLQLLQFAARELANMNVLVVGTYRDTDLVRTHPLSETLAELNRESGFVRVPLSGLSRDELVSYVRQRAGTDPAQPLVARLYEETEGNPFFLSEMVNLMADEGTLDSTSVSDIALPDGVREALGRRLDRLSDEANQLLQFAAVVGREFAHETLDLLDDHDPDALLGLIEEGLRARVIEEDEHPGRYRFTHALMQETLLDELSTTRRVRLHGRVAEALERRWGDRSDQHAARLALHYSDSATLTPQHAAKAVHYLAIAAREAETGFGWAEAARQYERAVTLIDESDGVEFADDIAELLTAFGLSALYSQRFRDFWRAIMRALDLYRARGDGDGFARASLVLGTTGGVVATARVVPILEEALDLLGDRDEGLWAGLIADLDVSDSRLAANGSDEVAADRRERAFEIAQRLRLVRVERQFRDNDAARYLESGEFEAAITALTPQSDQPSGAPSLVSVGGSTSKMVAATLIGRMDRAVQVGLDEIAAYERVGEGGGVTTLSPGLAYIYSARGENEAAATIDQRFSDSQYFAWLGFRALRALFSGDPASALTLLPRPEDAAGVPASAAGTGGIRAAVFAHLDQHDQAAAGYHAMGEAIRATGRRGLAAGKDITGRDLGYSLGPWVFADGFAWRYADGAERETLRAIILEPKGFFLGRLWFQTPIQRQLADCALGFDMLDDAERLFRDALQWSEREHFGTEAGRCHLGLAQIAERRGDPVLATRHLDTAGELFAQQGAKFFLDQVIAKKEILKA